MQTITLLGSTGSIGHSTLSIVEQHPDKYRIFALTAQCSVDLLFQQCCQFQPEIAVMVDPDSAQQLIIKIKESGLDTQVLSGQQALEQVANDNSVDYVVAAIVGAPGLLPTLAAAKAGKKILLANKEALVMSGQLLVDAVLANNAVLLPVDSEHNAIWQCLPRSNRQHYDYNNLGIRRIILTASGGPFRDFNIEELSQVTPEQAIAHPNWSMGQKISVDSATMMNKGLEVIEAHWLFGLPHQQIEVLLHKESIIHSMVDYLDGSMLAQLGNPDMRTPIANALSWPERIDAGVEPLNLATIGKLQFSAPEPQRFPCLGLAYQALKAGGTATTILNAANEEAVSAFLKKRIAFTKIAEIIERVMNAMTANGVESLEQLLTVDREARLLALQFIDE